ncbi:MAG: glycosyltransferase [Saprospiraceae bacterium]
MENTLVSIIMPTFNHEKFIKTAINSVLAQTYAYWELLIIDDGSIDETKNICEKFARLDKRIKYYYSNHKGIYNLKENYNFCLKQSKGEWIAILEGDDYWYPDKLSLQMNNIANNIVLCYSNVDYIDAFGRTTELPKHLRGFSNDTLNNIPSKSILNIMKINFPIPLTWLINRDYLMHIGGFIQSNNIPFVDRETIYELCKLGPFKYINKSLGFYRTHPNQVTSIRKLEILNKVAQITISYLDNLKESDEVTVYLTKKEIEINRKINILEYYYESGTKYFYSRKYSIALKYYFLCLIKFPLFFNRYKIKSLLALMMAPFKAFNNY